MKPIRECYIISPKLLSAQLHVNLNTCAIGISSSGGRMVLCCQLPRAGAPREQGRCGPCMCEEADQYPLRGGACISKTGRCSRLRVEGMSRCPTDSASWALGGVAR